jgi:uncharacterized protein YndB with AHSA1/START domain
VAAEFPAPVMVRQRVHVELSLPEAFWLFTEGINQWWPLEEGYSYGGSRSREIHLEPREGGRFFERFVDGDELVIGRVVVCAPPERIVFTWRSPDWAVETEVDVRLVADGAGGQGTTVLVEHRGFERLGPQGQAIGRRWGGGWPRVLEAFVAGSSREG